MVEAGAKPQARPVDAVLFDLDGTLADTAPDLSAALNRVRCDRGLEPVPLARLRPYASHGARGLIGAGMAVAPGEPAYEALRDAFLAHYAALPWNVPERRNFSGSLASRLLVYLMKCVPVTRGGERGEVAGVLARLVHLLGRGEAVLVLPEGGRSRSGRVDVENATYGVGRVIGDLPECRVLCVYLRGEHQDGFSDLPARGERFHVRLAALRPTSEQKGMRRARDLSQQVVRTLAQLEQSHFQARSEALR